MMQRFKGMAAICALGMSGVVIAACGSSAEPDATPASTRAVVLVSGLATQTPYTTSTQACAQGLAAGNSVSALRANLIAAGNQVFTAPAQTGSTQVTSTTGLGASSECPTPLPTDMTINTTAGIDEGGESLTNFLSYLKETFQIDTVDLVGHSMGGLFAASAIKNVKSQTLPIKVRSLTTLSTPWGGTYPADYAAGDLEMSVCANQPRCVETLNGYQELADEEGPDGAALAITTEALIGPGGWVRDLGDTLDGIPVTLIGGSRFVRPDGNPRVWPNDAVVALDSSLAVKLKDKTIQHRSCLNRPDVHTTTIAGELNLPPSFAITWDPEVLNAVNNAVKDADNAMSSPNRQGCP